MSRYPATEALARREQPMMKPIRASRLTVPNVYKWNFEELQRRAEQQIERAEAEEIQAVRQAFAGIGDQE